MGMFDYVSCEIPLPCCNGWLFQSKDLDDEMKRWTIRSNGTLVKHEYDTEMTPDEELPEKNRNAPEGSLLKLFGVIRTVKGSERDVVCNYDGDVIFYPDVQYRGEHGDEEFRATFRKGVVTEICQMADGSWQQVYAATAEAAR